jgi:hypothetical protein
MILPIAFVALQHVNSPKSFLGGTTLELLNYVSRQVKAGSLGLNDIVKGIGPSQIVFEPRTHRVELIPSYATLFEVSWSDPAYLFAPKVYPYQFISTSPPNNSPVQKPNEVSKFLILPNGEVSFLGIASAAKLAEQLRPSVAVTISPAFQSVEFVSSGVFMKPDSFVQKMSLLLGARMEGDKNSGYKLAIDPVAFRSRMLQTLRLHTDFGVDTTIHDKLRLAVVRDMTEQQLIDCFENPAFSLRSTKTVDKPTQKAVSQEFERLRGIMTEEQRASFPRMDDRRPIEVAVRYRARIGFIVQDSAGNRISF